MADAVPDVMTAYAEHHQIQELLEAVVTEILTERPADPLEYLARLSIKMSCERGHLDEKQYGTLIDQHCRGKLPDFPSDVCLPPSPRSPRLPGLPGGKGNPPPPRTPKIGGKGCGRTMSFKDKVDVALRELEEELSADKGFAGRELTEWEAKVMNEGATDQEAGPYGGRKFLPTRGYFGCKKCGTPLYLATAKFVH
jgi:hypothetical protein